jgi:DNA-binding response OmpR family regulator
MARVLAADDDRNICRLLETILEGAGHEVICQPDGARTLIAAHEKKPDVVLLDLVMPIMDGLTALRLLKSHAETCDIPIIIITGKDEAANVRSGYDLGADLLLGKPFDPEDVLECVDRLLPEG